MHLDNITISRSTDRIDHLNWDISPEEIQKTTEKIISDAKSKIDDIIALEDSSRTFENTVLAFETVETDIKDDFLYLQFLAYVSSDEAVRKASTDARTAIEKYEVERRMNFELYKVLKDVQRKNLSLTSEEQWLFDHVIRDFKRNGLDLETEKQDKIGKIKKEIADLKVQFSQTLNNWSEKVIFTPEELEGVPENTMGILKKDDDGNYIAGMSYPEVYPILEYAVNPGSRLKILKEFLQRGGNDNLVRMEKVIKLRDEAAKLLGYPDHASYTHEIRMAEKPENVKVFLADLEEKLKVKARGELAGLIELKDEELGDSSDGVIHQHDWLYYVRMNRKIKYKVDKEEVKKYFPATFVVEKMLDFYQEMLGLTFTLIKSSKWHEDVSVYAVSDKETKELIGQFYMDIFPRDGKFNHAAAFSLVKGRELPSGKYQATLSAMVANFNKPTETSPSLLPHSDVITLFHEFGHIIHQMITTVKYGRFSGTLVKRDFVEVPSQMLENWVWEPVVLEKITNHYQENKPLPVEMVNRLIAAKNAYSGLMNLRQIFLGKYDLAAYTQPGFDLVKKWDDLIEKTSLIKPEKGIAPASFVHIIDGYDAAYYGYLWAEVFAQDMYTRFKKEGPTSKEIGMSFRRCILEPGSSVEEASQIENFLGRKPENKAFLKSIGLE